MSYDLPYVDLDRIETPVDPKDAHQRLDALDRRLAEVERLVDGEQWAAAHEALSDLREDTRAYSKELSAAPWSCGPFVVWSQRLSLFNRWMKQVGVRLDWRSYFARGAV